MPQSESRRYVGDPKVTAMAGENAAVATVEYDGIVAYGDSKRNHGEVRNADVGLDLAIGRAFIRLGDEFVDRAYAQLDSQEG